MAVLRRQTGAPVSLADGQARYQARVEGIAGDEVRLTILTRTPLVPALPRLTVVQGLPTGRKLDEVVQRLSEIGVDRLVPVTTARSEVRLSDDNAVKAVKRWRAVALAAAKQSRRGSLLRVEAVSTWARAFPPGTVGAVLWEQSSIPLRAVLPDLGGTAELVLGIGPEGGLTPGEVAAAGLPTATLGPTILRTETAALVGATAVLTLTGRLA